MRISGKLKTRCSSSSPLPMIGDVVILADQHAVAGVFVQDGAQFLHQIVDAGLAQLILEHLVPVFADLSSFPRALWPVSDDMAQFGQRHRDGVSGVRSGSSKIVPMASRRKPSTPRSSQKRTASHMACLTSGLRQFRSGCCFMK